jgi:DNA invertase Pin-like site-specific DNA recombinase
MSKTQKRCAIYTRCASASTDGKNILEQEEQCHAYINKHDNNGWIFVEKIYRDDGVSGMNLNRLGLNQLIDDAKRQKFDYMVTTCPSRLSRKLDESGYLCHVLQSYGVEVHYAQRDVSSAAKEIGRA